MLAAADDDLEDDGGHWDYGGYDDDDVIAIEEDLNDDCWVMDAESGILHSQHLSQDVVHGAM